MLITSQKMKQQTQPCDATGSAIEVPLHFHCPQSQSIAAQPVTLGIPIPRGRLGESICGRLRIGSKTLSVQTQTLTRWSDRSARWVLVDATLPSHSDAAVKGILELNDLGDEEPSDSDAGTASITVQRSADGPWRIDTTAAAYRVFRRAERPLLTCTAGSKQDAALEVAFHHRDGRQEPAIANELALEAAGPLRATVKAEGEFALGAGLQWTARLCFFAGSGLFRLRLTIRNPRPARHPGGCWDLGDRGSLLFAGLTARLRLPPPARGALRLEPDSRWRDVGPSGAELLQESSGGENWQSRNHVNRNGVVPLRHRGYRVACGEESLTGDRALPVAVQGDESFCAAVAVPEFWQQFPKSLKLDEQGIEIGLFPTVFGDLHELQGGEQKTHSIWFRLEPDPPGEDCLDWVHRPVQVLAEPSWYEAANVWPWLSAADRDDPRFAERMKRALAGPRSLLARREVIDEYGWRHFGDDWADHEQAYYDGPRPIISHYNNQFDRLAGALLQMMRSGETGWWALADPLARHVIDVDIYHTQGDKAAYNGGLFWFTDHYLDAATSTHRTYSRHNARPGRPYGGGPGSEHAFATGLLLYHCLTGDPLAAESVVSLADWIVAMDDGARTLLGAVEKSPTGLASLCGTPDYTGPGRGAANSMGVLLDGLLLTGEARYLRKAEQLIRRSIHPQDDIDALDLLDAEHHWSYTMFLTALARYLEVKQERDECDAMYGYAQHSLLHYARWMRGHERPYLDHREQLEYPTETWAAQEFRKANVLRCAARHADEKEAEPLRQRAAEIVERAWQDWESFDQPDTTRALAIVMTEGTMEACLRESRGQQAEFATPPESWPGKEPFVPQKQRVGQMLRSPTGWCRLAFRLGRPAAWRHVWRHIRQAGPS